MIDHVVLFRWRAGVSEDSRLAVERGVAELASLIPGIVRFAAGAQESPEDLGRGLEFGFVITFTDAAARDAYLPHPEHQRVVAELMGPNVEDVLVFDFSHGSEIDSAI